LVHKGVLSMVAFMYRKVTTALLVLLVCSFISLPSHALALNEFEKIFAGDTTGQFGRAMAVNGDTMVIGALDSAFVYRFDGNAWIEEQKITAPGDLPQLAEFGSSVAVSADTVVIGTTVRLPDFVEREVGPAYVYRFDGNSWIEEQKLIANELRGVSGTRGFGRTVAVSGDTIVVGDFNSDGVVSRSGAAFVYRFDGNSWIEVQKLTGSDSQSRDLFGYSVAIDGDAVVIGALTARNETGSGSVYAYRYDGNSWIEEQKLASNSGDPNGRFGAIVSLSNDRLAIGDTPSVVPRRGSVSVYRFAENSWIEDQEFTPNNPEARDYSLNSVALSGDTVVFGADFGGRYINVVNAYRFDGSTWGQGQDLVASDIMPSDVFGRSVAVHRDTVFVTSKGATGPGSVYVFSLDNNTAPTITSDATRTVPENQTSAIDVNANDDSDSEGAGLTYAITDGADQLLFDIDATNGVVSFISEPDFEAPSDAGSDNVYNIAVTVTDSTALSDTQAIAITVEDEDEPPVVDTDVECEFIVVADWNRGYIGVIRLSNNGDSPVTSGWTVNWSYEDGTKVARLWNADWQGDDGSYTASALSWNSTIQPRRYVQFGMKNTKPSLNAPAEAPQVTGDICN